MNQEKKKISKNKQIYNLGIYIYVKSATFENKNKNKKFLKKIAFLRKKK